MIRGAESVSIVTMCSRAWLRVLGRMARSYDWPVLDLDEEPARSAGRRPQGLAPVRKLRRDKERH
jgi:hypothetical protein